MKLSLRLGALAALGALLCSSAPGAPAAPFQIPVQYFKLPAYDHASSALSPANV